MKKDVRKAMEKAKELEKIPVPSKEEIVAIYKEGLEEAEKLRKLLKPQWFVHDEKLNKKTPASTRKKKTL
jgi:hypothetical protein